MKNGKTKVELETYPGGQEKEMMDMIEIHETPLPYPTEKLVDARGATYESYQIPMKDKANILREYYPFTPVPKMDDELLDIHENKAFTVKDFLIIRENGRNYLVSPYYPKSYGTVLDWVSTDSSMGCYIHSLKPETNLSKK